MRTIAPRPAQRAWLAVAGVCCTCAPAPQPMHAPFAAGVVHEGSAVTGFRAAFRDALKTQEAALLRCHIAGLPHGVPLSGSFELRLVVDPSGALRELTSNAEAKRFANLSSCVEGVVRGLRFAPTGLQQPLGFDYAFVVRTVLMFQRNNQDSGFVFAAVLPDRFEITLDATRVGVATATVPSTAYETDGRFAAP